MNDLISREAVVHVLCEENINRPLDSDRWLISDIYKKIKELPTVDAVEVVRCKDCKHKVTTEDGEYNPHDIVCDYWESDGLEETDFCSYGERRTDA